MWALGVYAMKHDSYAAQLGRPRPKIAQLLSSHFRAGSEEMAPECNLVRNKRIPV